MAQAEWLANENIALSKVVVVVEVRATEASGLDGYLDFICGERSKVSVFLHFWSENEVNDARLEDHTVRRSFAPCRTDALMVVAEDMIKWRGEGVIRST